MTFRYKSLSIVAGLFVVAAVQLFLFTPSANAAIGDAGTPTSDSDTGSYYTTNGFGWYSYDVNSASGPDSWSSGGPWSTVRSQCISEGASRVDAFIVQAPGGDNSGNNAKVYRYEAGGYSTNWTEYKGDYGGNWLSIATAQSHFNSIEDKGSYVFGSNVAWFCYNPYNYELTPTITGTPAFTDGDSGGSDKATLTPIVSNAAPTGSTSSSKNTSWKVVTFIVPKGSGVPGKGDSASPPENYYGYSAIAVASGTQVFGRGTTGLSVGQQAIGDFPLGTKICYALSVAPISQGNGNWRHSDPFCVIIAKAPKFQVWGGDIRAGAGFIDQPATGVSTVNASQTTKYR